MVNMQYKKLSPCIFPKTLKFNTYIIILLLCGVLCWQNLNYISHWHNIFWLITSHLQILNWWVIRKSATSTAEVTCPACTAHTVQPLFCWHCLQPISLWCTAFLSMYLSVLFHGKLIKCSRQCLDQRGLKLEDNIKMYLREIWWKDERWMELAQDHVQRQALVLATV
jgi:hypothetical protein